MINILVTTALFLVSVAAVIAGIFHLVAYARRKLNRPCFVALACLVVAGLVAVPVFVFRGDARRFELSVVPPAMHVDTIVYRNEKAWGFGPGGNEAGIRVFALPDDVARDMSRRGKAWFDALPLEKFRRSRSPQGTYYRWHETPVRADNHWKPRPETGRFDIYDYICAYGFCIDIDDAVVRQATRLVNTGGSYYAYGRIGIIVVSPREKVVLYMYNG